MLLFLLLLFTVCRSCVCDVRTHTNKITQSVWKTSYVCKLDHLLVVRRWEDKGNEEDDRQRPTTTKTIQLVLAPKKICLFNALSICLRARSMFLIDTYIYIYIYNKERIYKQERNGKEDRKEEEEIMDLCVLRVDIPREQVILTLCMHAFSSSLSLMASRVRRSKLINHRKSITRRDEGVSFAPERQKRKSLMSYTTDTYTYLWIMHEKLIFRLYFMCLSTSIRCETVEMVRDEGSNPDHYY